MIMPHRGVGIGERVKRVRHSQVHSIEIRNILKSAVCRIDGDVLDANTKVYGDGHAPFKHFFFSFS